MHIRFAIAACAASLVSPSFAADELAAVVVTATRQATRVNELLADVTVIDREAIERSGGGTVADLLARQPGVQVVTLGPAGTQTDIMLRGARSEQTKILIDGIPFNSMDLRGSPLRFLSIEQIDRIEILRGAASAIHGSDAIGGVIQIFTRHAQQGLHGDVSAGTGSYGTDKFSASLAFGDKLWSARVFVADHRSDGFSAVRGASSRDADADGFRNRSAGGRLALRPAAGQEFTLSGLSNRGESHNDATSGAGTFDSRYHFRNEVWSIGAKNRLSEIWDSTLRLGYNIDEQNSYTSALASGFSPLRSTNRTLAWQNDVRLPLGQALLALESQQQHAAPASRFPITSAARLDALQVGWNASLGSHRWQLGARNDRHSQFGGAGTGSASYGYQFSHQWRAHAGASTSFRAPTLYQLYASKAGSLVANPALLPERARNLELGLTHEHAGQMFSVVAYRNRVSDLIDYDTPTLSYRNISKVRLRGWTFSWQGQVADFGMNASLDLLDPVDESTGLRLGRRAREKMSLAVDRQWNAWKLGAELIAQGRRFDRDNETRPLGGYGIVNLTARWAMAPNVDLELRGDNVLDKYYTNALTSSGAFTYATPGASVFVGVRYSR